MAKNIFDTIRVNSKDQSRSFRWYQEQVKKLGRVTQNRLMNEVKETSRLSVGKMYLFAYNPKHKDILPYYDTFPLVLPFRKMSEGFLGVNLHYLPYLVRFKTLGYLNDIANDDTYDEATRVSLSWRMLESYSRLSPLKACVKHYLTIYLESSFYNIPYQDWVIASQLPVESFKKMEKQDVWDITGKKYNG